MCDIYCYLCPHIFWVYYFSLSHGAPPCTFFHVINEKNTANPVRLLPPVCLFDTTEYLQLKTICSSIVNCKVTTHNSGHNRNSFLIWSNCLTPRVEKIYNNPNMINIFSHFERFHNVEIQTLIQNNLLINSFVASEPPKFRGSSNIFFKPSFVYFFFIFSKPVLTGVDWPIR